MRAVLLVAAAVVVAVLAGGCGGGGGGTPVVGNCLIRVIHVGPGVPAVDMWIGGRKLFTSLSYGQRTAYASITAGNVNVVADSAGTTGAVANNIGAASLTSGHNYTVLLTSFYYPPQVTQEQPWMFMPLDDLTGIQSGDSKLRILNVAPDVSGTVQITRGPGLAPWQMDQYETSALSYDVAPGTFPIQVRLKSDTTQVFASDTLRMTAGLRYTLIFTGKSPTPGHRVMVFQDTSSTVYAPVWPTTQPLALSAPSGRR